MNNGGFTLGGLPAKHFHLQMFGTSQRPVLPETRDRFLDIPGRHGVYDFGADLGPRRFDLECAFITGNASQVQQLARVFAAYLMDNTGRPRTLPLVFDIEPGLTYQVRYSGSLPIQRIAGLGKFTLPLIAIDPFANVPSDKYDKVYFYDTGLEYDTDLYYPNPTGFTWQYVEQRSGIYNYSSFETGIQITITGESIGPSITHEQTGKTLNLPTLSPGDVLVIDTKKYQVTLNGANALAHISGDFFGLVVGDNSLVFRSSLSSALVTFDWKMKYL